LIPPFPGSIPGTELLSVVRIIEERGALELANRALSYAGQIFMYGIATGRADRNPANDLRGALKTHVKKNYTHLKEVDLPEFIQKLERFQDITPQTKLALKMLLLTFVRTAELRGATWAEIDFDKAEWRISPERMKMKRGHIVPLSPLKSRNTRQRCVKAFARPAVHKIMIRQARKS